MCCNPLNAKLHGSKMQKSNMRRASDSIRKKLKSLKPGDVLCAPCRKNFFINYSSTFEEKKQHIRIKFGKFE